MRPRLWFRRAWLPATITCLLAVAGPLAATAQPRPLVPRAPPSKPAHTVVRASEYPGRVIVKFAEGTDVRWRSGRFEGGLGVDGRGLASVLAAHGVGPRAVRRLFQSPESDLDTRREHARQRLGREMADLNLYYRIDVHASTDAALLCDALNALPYVELATPAPRIMLPVDLPPSTPDFSAGQTYRGSPPAGIGALDPAVVPGSDGVGITLVDIEGGWILDHEDLELPPTANIVPGTIPPNAGVDHGTAVLGIVAGLGNNYGITGIAPAATVLVAPHTTIVGGETQADIAGAIDLATGVLGPGDVMLLEMQICVCNNSCSLESQLGFGPVEWLQPYYDVISIAAGNGIVVIEAAGNGSVNLDDPSCFDRFDRATRDSGAILVGAGDGFQRRLSFSDHGSRVDVQAWGASVTTTGYGDLFDPADERQRYTAGFSGTSSASAIVASAALAIQGTRLAQSLAPLDPLVLRQLLVDTGGPQNACDPTDEHIGSFPNVPGALGLAACEDGLDNDGDGQVDSSDPDCTSPSDPSEDPPPQCSDGLDNDGDGRTDGADADCSGASDDAEFNLRPSDLLVADTGPFEDHIGGTGKLIRVDPLTGFQTVLTRSGAIADPTAVTADVSGVILGLDFTAATVFEVNPEGGGVSTVSSCASRPWGLAVEASGDLVMTDDSWPPEIVRIDPDTGVQTTVSSGGVLVIPRGIAIDAAGHFMIADQGATGFGPPAVIRVDSGTGAQTTISSAGSLAAPRGLAIEADGNLVVADQGFIVRVDPVSGDQSIVSSGGNLVSLAGISVDACTGDLFVAERGNTGGNAALVRVDPGTGTQTVVSSGGDFVEPFGTAIVPGPCESLLLQGTAAGGSVGVLIEGVLVSVPTSPGQSLAEIATALALAIRGDQALEALGIAATVSGNTVLVHGDTGQIVPFSNDSGITIQGPFSPPLVPSLSPGSLEVLALLLAGAAILLLRGRGRRRGRG